MACKIYTPALAKLGTEAIRGGLCKKLPKMAYATFASFLLQIQLVLGHPGHLLHQLQPVFGHPRFQECHERISSWLVSQDPGDRDERLNSDLFLKSHGPLVCADGDLPLLGRPRVFVRQPWEEEECRSAGRWRHLRDRASWCTRGDEAVPTCTPNRVDVTFQLPAKYFHLYRTFGYVTNREKDTL